jgi:DNA invertase Pin-like site-specific DNA recombinase
METQKQNNMKIKYNRVSTLQQTGERYNIDKEKYDLVLLDKISGSIPFRERPMGKKLEKLISEGKVKDLVVEEFSRLGRNTGDVITTLEWLEENEINVIVRNIGLQSRPNNDKNPIWKMISSVMSSLYEMELENIKERTAMGRQVYLQNGGRLGRPTGSNESENKFLKKQKTQEIIKLINKGRTIREIAAITSTSNKTIIKTKKIGEKYGLTN